MQLLYMPSVAVLGALCGFAVWGVKIDIPAPWGCCAASYGLWWGSARCCFLKKRVGVCKRVLHRIAVVWEVLKM